jgi:hypothetical protein
VLNVLGEEFWLEFWRLCAELALKLRVVTHGVEVDEEMAIR